mmetsp:Transcript_5288/g.12969  ORF Transcript_5288/g.12969 Transcript_5288/m.12969 type:complete len:233 (-) Transcript_5288:924-1622(-)
MFTCSRTTRSCPSTSRTVCASSCCFWTRERRAPCSSRSCSCPKSLLTFSHSLPTWPCLVRKKRPTGFPFRLPFVSIASSCRWMPTTTACSRRASCCCMEIHTRPSHPLSSTGSSRWRTRTKGASTIKATLTLSLPRRISRTLHQSHTSSALLTYLQAVISTCSHSIILCATSLMGYSTRATSRQCWRQSLTSLSTCVRFGLKNEGWSKYLLLLTGSSHAFRCGSSLHPAQAR